MVKRDVGDESLELTKAVLRFEKDHFCHRSYELYGKGCAEFEMGS